MSFITNYSYGRAIPTPEWPESAREAIDALTGARAEFGICRNCYDMSYGTRGTEDDNLNRRIAIMSIGGIGNEILDDSNEYALEQLGEAWSPESHTHSGVGTTVCIDPADVDPDILADMIRTAEHFAEYPVLDESDYSERELAAFRDCFDWETTGEDAHGVELGKDHPAYARAGEIAMGYMGNSEAGSISAEHVAACWDSAISELATA